jgi:hypothetical protein
MFARSLAMFALISMSAAASEPSAGAITIYLKAGTADVAAVTYMKRELSGLMQTAGYRLEWLNASGAIPDVRNGQLVVLDLTGNCSAARGSGESASEDLGIESLASTPVSDGQVLPFSTLRCDSLNRVLGRIISAEPPQRRPWLYGRAMARLAAHELYHVLSDTREHSREGVSKPCFSARDLLADHFEFENAALARMKQVAPAGTSPSPIVASETPNGRQ